MRTALCKYFQEMDIVFSVLQSIHRTHTGSFCAYNNERIQMNLEPQSQIRLEK